MAEDYPSEDCLILPEKLPPALYRKLVFALTINRAWERLVDYFHTEGIFEAEDLFNVTQNAFPAERLLVELGCRLCDVGTLCSILESCNLYNALLLFRPREAIRVIEQPHGRSDNNSLMVARGGTLHLSCYAVGFPPPTYQWCFDDQELAGYNNIDNEGDYYCVLNQDDHDSITSHVVPVSLAPEHPVVLQQPRSTVVCRLGSNHVISVHADGHPRLNYQWFKGCRQLDGCTASDLKLDIITVQDEGDYRCYIYNTAGEIWSDICRVATFASPEDIDETQPRPVASAKVALLIANQDYHDLASLRTPIEDARTIAEILANHDFQIIALQNLSLIEMRNAIKELCKILPRNAYVVFYFAGHGFEMKDKYMLPICAPGPGLYMMKDTVAEGELLRDVLNTQPQVFLELLDMCLKSPEEENKAIFQEVSALHQYSANNNLIQGYSTTSYLSSYERKSERNGLYVKFLKQYLSQDIPMVTVLANVARDMEKERVKQMPYRGTNVTKSFRLTDPCLDCTAVKMQVEALCKVPEIQVMKLERSGLESLVTCVPYLGVYNNAMQVIFTNLQEYMITCDIMEKDVQLLLERQGKEAMITVLNLQKIRSSDVILQLELVSRVDLSIDHASWKLERPMIAAANLWCDENPEYGRP